MKKSFLHSHKCSWRHWITVTLHSWSKTVITECFDCSCGYSQAHWTVASFHSSLTTAPTTGYFLHIVVCIAEHHWTSDHDQKTTTPCSVLRKVESTPALVPQLTVMLLFQFQIFRAASCDSWTWMHSSTGLPVHWHVHMLRSFVVWPTEAKRGR